MTRCNSCKHGNWERLITKCETCIAYNKWERDDAPRPASFITARDWEKELQRTEAMRAEVRKVKSRWVYRGHRSDV